MTDKANEIDTLRATLIGVDQSNKRLHALCSREQQQRLNAEDRAAKAEAALAEALDVVRPFATMAETKVGFDMQLAFKDFLAARDFLAKHGGMG